VLARWRAIWLRRTFGHRHVSLTSFSLVRNLDESVMDVGERNPEHMGRRRFIGAIGSAVGAGTLVAGLPEVAHAAVPRSATRFVPLAKQVRLADTRRASSAHRNVGVNRIRVKVAGANGVPPTATAAVFTVTAVSRSPRAFVAVFPSDGDIPVVSNLNLGFVGDVAANLATVRLGNGSVDVYSNNPVDMVLDLAGYYEPVSAAVTHGRFIPLPVAKRVIDTRERGRIVGKGKEVAVFVDAVGLGIANATSVVINLTVTNTVSRGFFTCYPFGVDLPPTSNLNVNGSGQVRAGAAIVRLGKRNGRPGFSVYSQNGGHVIVDVAGYYTGETSAAGTDGMFVPVTPRRILDTRTGLGGPRGRLWHRWMVETKIPSPADARAGAVVTNVTAVEARGQGFFTLMPAGTPRQNVSNLNAMFAGQVVPNHAISAITTRGVAVYAHTGAHILIDYAGWFTGRPQLPTVSYRNPPPPAVGPPWRLEIPALRFRGSDRRGHVSFVLPGDPHAIVDAGHTWHWTGTGFMGQRAHVGLFAHRTDTAFARSPWYNLHELRANDEIFIQVDTPGDRRRFRYRVVRSDLVLNVLPESPAQTKRILDVTRLHPGTTISLIACTEPNRLPTSLKHRLIYTAALVDVVEDGIQLPRP
jgi:hypothetical protein